MNGCQRRLRVAEGAGRTGRRMNGTLERGRVLTLVEDLGVRVLDEEQRDLRPRRLERVHGVLVRHRVETRVVDLN
jgi:hypothetical protein